MKLTASVLVAQSVCGFLRHVQYGARQPLPFLGSRRRFGTAVHAAIAVYEKSGCRLEPALDALPSLGLPPRDLHEARAILAWRHARERDPSRRPFLIEGSLHVSLDDHRLEVRMDRLDRREGEYVLAEYKAGRRVDLEPLRAQLRILSYVIGRTLGRTPSEWEVELLGARRIFKLPAERQLSELERFTGDLARAVARDDREPDPTDATFCRRCPARSFCPRATPDPRPLPDPSRREESAQLNLF